MAKTRAQRKAERRKREQEAERQQQAGAPDAGAEARAQEDTRKGVSGEEAEFEAVMETGAKTEDYGERTVDHGAEPDQGGSPVPGVVPGPVSPEAPAPSRADVGVPDGAETEAPAKESREQRRARKQREKEDRRQARAKDQQKKAHPEKPEKRRGAVTGFIASCWAELKRVQWPDRDTLVQATAVTFIFIAVMAAYLGALDALFNWFVKQIL